MVKKIQNEMHREIEEFMFTFSSATLFRAKESPVKKILSTSSLGLATTLGGLDSNAALRSRKYAGGS